MNLTQLVDWLRTSDEARKSPPGEIADRLQVAITHDHRRYPYARKGNLFFCGDCGEEIPRPEGAPLISFSDESTNSRLEELQAFKERFPGIEVQEYCRKRMVAIVEIFGEPAAPSREETK